MQNLRKKFIAPFAFILAAFSVPLAAYAGDGGQPAGDVTRGVQAWGNNCARCHNMRDPKEFRDDQWRVTVSHMRIRAGLTGQEARDILTFLQSAN